MSLKFSQDGISYNGYSVAGPLHKQDLFIFFGGGVVSVMPIFVETSLVKNLNDCEQFNVVTKLHG